MNFKGIISTVLFGVLFLVGCTETPVEDDPQLDPCNPADAAGELVSVTSAGSYTPEQLQALLTGFGAPSAVIGTYSVDAYTVQYRTTDKSGNLVDASGVMFIPQNLDTLDLLSVQHGTVFRKSDVGSELIFMAYDGLILAMDGYLVVEADYLGLGISEGLHPYLHADLSANPVIDIVRAARAYACQNELNLSSRLFLAGYSEGGYVTLASHKKMESDFPEEFELMAVAPMAGPYDLLGSTQEILSRGSYGNPAYLAYLVGAYDDVYEWNRLGDIFNPPYAERIPIILDGQHDGGQINDSLTTDMTALFNADFIAGFQSGEEEEIVVALEENSLLEWMPEAPVRFFHGTADSTVFYSNAQAAYESFISQGAGQVDLVPLYGMDHGSAVFSAFYYTLEWFDSLRTAN